ncbi:MULTISPECIES: three-Cys-motif partner protein TcmP [Cyanophyceae]|uniref:three-Cys-motif partner protein TcmP n=1 Tax=Cyanophyceae TaxID=3028117 RepID=UPI001682A343|nr:three-Cys-motif partner protein TcmP [Trichocoleus sp. FACHB-69]MBD1931841.1 three-Cys-motif partner protein TcmP [Trichocoleus sp. FACHB-69]
MSNKKKYEWSADGSELPTIPLYAKTKHLVLQEYVKNWIEVLCGHGRHGVKKVTLVDGFCGGGMYKDGEQLWEGSAIRMIRMVEEGLKNVQQRKPWHQLDAEYIFIDNNKEHTSCLELQIKKAGLEEYLYSGKCKIITNEFEKELDRCIDKVKLRRGYSFFFLDPFGLDVTPEIVKPIISIGRSEVLFTHMLSGLVRILSRKDRIHKKTFQDFEVDEYYKDLADQSDFLTKQGYLRNQGLLLYRKEGDVEYAWTFAIMNSLKNVLYYLIHLSSNPTALEVMKKTLVKYNNLEYQYHYGVYGLGFRELDYFDKNLSTYNIKEANIETCMNKLREQFMKILAQNEDGISFEQLRLKTIQENPATIEHYFDVLHQLKLEKEVKVVREKKITTSKKIESKDIIIRAKDKPLWIPGLPYKFSNEK